MGCPVIVSYLLTKYGASPQDISAVVFRISKQPKITRNIQA